MAWNSSPYWTVPGDVILLSLSRTVPWKSSQSTSPEGTFLKYVYWSYCTHPGSPPNGFTSTGNETSDLS